MAEYFFHQIESEFYASFDDREKFELFDEEEYPLSVCYTIRFNFESKLQKVVDLKQVTVEKVEIFISRIQVTAKVALESLVIATVVKFWLWQVTLYLQVYFNRVKDTRGLKLYTFNWRRVLLICIIIASKSKSTL